MKFRFNKIGIPFVSFMVLFSSLASPIDLVDFKPTAVKRTPPEYRWIHHISTGPEDTSTLDDSPDGVRGMFYRLAFVENTDVFIRPTMRIDEINYYDAGCCWTSPITTHPHHQEDS